MCHEKDQFIRFYTTIDVATGTEIAQPSFMLSSVKASEKYHLVDSRETIHELGPLPEGVASPQPGDVI